MCKLTIEKLFLSYIRNRRGFGDLEMNCDFLTPTVVVSRLSNIKLMIILLMVNEFN